MGKHRVRTLSLGLIVALSLVVLGSTNAQAATPEFKILGTTLKGTESIAATSKSASLLFESTIGIANTPIIKHCTTVSLDNSAIFGSSETLPGTGLLEALISNCKTLLFEGGSFKESTNCKPLEPILLKARFKPILHEGRTYILVQTHTGETFVEIEFHAPCALPLKTPIKGELIAECLTASVTNEDCSESTVHKLLAPADSAIFTGANGLPKSQGITFGTKSMKLVGILDVFLNGANTGCNWAAI